ncbi:valosin containing protein (p97) p47 complex interacting protein 1 [Nesidiocoris tenuis]|uniref:Valosin containing protein (p97) p47 complex interacting protein 1 n=1 Tax=Nesidiocoris tenuis TaxID=355587 RepID=A0ABN7BH52_9HEMI|nr:valosin containing protein (p97) p47 complex interacting protein 1 [Nesidiocoris tenuis]
MWKGTCLDECCRQVLLFPGEDPFVTCYVCGQTHATESFPDRAPFDPALDPYNCIIHTPASKLNIPQRAPDLVEVMGFSHYQHKLVSPLLTTFGMDKHTGKARSLKQITGRMHLDCSVFGDRSFSIPPRHLGIPGFGKDNASFEYLQDTLKVLLPYNNNVENLVPLHVDGDGHCLVHAISRAVVGRELFWHPLRVGLKQHLAVNLEKYKSLLGSFINNSEWPTIIDECEPDYRPGDGSMIGLRNIHVFGLANLLRRPIILLDSMAGMKASADYAGLFLPGLNPPMTCSNKSGQLNPPLCLAWSSAARNHYIPLVPVKDLPLPKIPRKFLPEVWGFPQDLLDSYMKFDDQGCVVIGGEGVLPQPYIARLTKSMDELFTAKNGVPPRIVADLFHYQYSTKLASNPKTDVVVDAASTCLKENKLLRCIACWAINVVPITSHLFRPGGHLYTHAKKLSGGYLREDFEYPFRSFNLTCVYDSRNDVLVIKSYTPTDPCSFCNEPNKLRLIRRDGSTVHQDGDRTNIPIKDNEKRGCPCGFKHWWGGNYHETRPLSIPIVLDWNGIVKKDNIEWFRHENNEDLNTNVYDIATLMIHKHFSDELNNDELQETIAAQILSQTKDIRCFESEAKEQVCREDRTSGLYTSTDHPSGSGVGSSYGVPGSSKSSCFREDFDYSQKDSLACGPANLYETSRKRPGDPDFPDAPSPKSPHLPDGRGSPKPSTSRLSPKYS